MPASHLNIKLLMFNSANSYESIVHLTILSLIIDMTSFNCFSQELKGPVKGLSRARPRVVLSLPSIYQACRVGPG